MKGRSSTILVTSAVSPAIVEPRRIFPSKTSVGDRPECPTGGLGPQEPGGAAGIRLHCGRRDRGNSDRVHGRADGRFHGAASRRGPPERLTDSPARYAETVPIDLSSPSQHQPIHMASVLANTASYSAQVQS